MTTATDTAFSVLSIREAADSQDDQERPRVRLRNELGIRSFATNAVRAGAAGTEIIREHDETGPGADRQEELYLVLAGSATFSVAGEEVEATHGTAVFVSDPETKRRAVANEDGTIIVIVGGRPGEPFRPSPGEAMFDFFEPYNAKDYAGALEVGKGILHRYPGNGLALYNIACMEALLGRADDAIQHLGEALETAPSLRGTAETDEDFASLRGDERFQSLIGD
jgi:tetratricopeptide (TPR) repeat protein